MQLTVRQAKPNEIDIAFDMFRKAALWLKERGLTYWQGFLEPIPDYKKWVQEGFDNNYFYFVQNESGEIAAVYRLQFEDELFWGKRNEKAGYFHSFTTDRKYYGTGLGAKILKMVEDDLRDKGYDYMRLDCNEHLAKYYQGLGFVPVGETSFSYTYKGILHEKKLR